MHQLQILNIREASGLDERLQPITFRVVSYKVGDEGPFTLRVPEDKFDEAAVRAELEAKAQQIRALLSSPGF